LASEPSVSQVRRISISGDATEIFKILAVEAAHRLPYLPPGHKCGRLHGHTFQIEVHVQGQPVPKSGWIINSIEDQIDRRYLNEVEGLENPTSENVASWVWQKLKPLLPSLSKIVIREACTSGCIYAGELEA
jgi:6-pyruvoyltetrahydropterin/6-carboxytetrahydropterin synthase